MFWLEILEVESLEDRNFVRGRLPAATWRASLVWTEVAAVR